MSRAAAASRKLLYPCVATGALLPLTALPASRYGPSISLCIPVGYSERYSVHTEDLWNNFHIPGEAGTRGGAWLAEFPAMPEHSLQTTCSLRPPMEFGDQVRDRFSQMEDCRPQCLWMYQPHMAQKWAEYLICGSVLAKIHYVLDRAAPRLEDRWVLHTPACFGHNLGNPCT